jgi:hypothetical protein
MSSSSQERSADVPAWKGPDAQLQAVVRELLAQVGPKG